MLTKAEFYKKHNGRAMDYDGVAGVQCVDLAKFYLNECFGIKPGSWGNARDYWYNTNPALLPYFKKIKNTKEFVPKRGDICIFDDSQKKYGHICIATNTGAEKNNTQYFYSYDQNYNNIKACTLTKHNYSRFLGVLRPKYWCAKQELNIRAGAGTEYEILGTLHKGEIREVYSLNDTWAEIGNGKYVSAKYLD
ncbi:MAG: CHAP domain-containing protein [Methanobrevibacter sp.]|nr:CHAP domain-containing protein [Methanobrevibacter sp.]